MTREEALKALDDILNYCEEIDYNLPKNEQSGYKMLPDIQKIRKYIIGNARPHGEWEYDDRSGQFICSECEGGVNMPTLMGEPLYKWCPWCGADMREEGDQNAIKNGT